MDSFISINNIKKCLLTKGYIWDGMIGATLYDEGRVAEIKDFIDNHSGVPVVLKVKGSSYDFDVLLKVTDLTCVLLQELYDPHDDDLIVEFMDLTEEWQNILKSEYGREYNLVLSENIQRKIDDLQSLCDSKVSSLRKEILSIEESARQEIDILKEKQKKILEEEYEPEPV